MYDLALRKKSKTACREQARAFITMANVMTTPVATTTFGTSLTKTVLDMVLITGILPTIVPLAANVAGITDLVASAPQIMHAFAIAIMGMGIVDHARVCLAPRKKFKNAWATKRKAAGLKHNESTKFVEIYKLV